MIAYNEALLYKVTIQLIVITKINDVYLSVQLILEVHALGQK